MSHMVTPGMYYSGRGISGSEIRQGQSGEKDIKQLKFYLAALCLELEKRGLQQILSETETQDTPHRKAHGIVSWWKAHSKKFKGIKANHLLEEEYWSRRGSLGKEKLSKEQIKALDQEFESRWENFHSRYGEYAGYSL